MFHCGIFEEISRREFDKGIPITLFLSESENEKGHSPKVVMGISPVLAEQLARELLLLESSDWQFLISTWSARDYAELRVREHYEDFMRLYDLIQKRARGVKFHIGDWEFLGDCEKRDNLFADIEVGWWA